MPNVVTDSNPITLADFEGLTSDKPVRQLIHTSETTTASLIRP